MRLFNELRASFHQFITQGACNDTAERFRRLICPLIFRRKQDNIAGIQLADLCAHPTVRHLLKPNNKNLAYESVRTHFYEGEELGLEIHSK
jgi:hypothetical protein